MVIKTIIEIEEWNANWHPIIFVFNINIFLIFSMFLQSSNTNIILFTWDVCPLKLSLSHYVKCVKFLTKSIHIRSNMWCNVCCRPTQYIFLIFLCMKYESLKFRNAFQSPSVLMRHFRPHKVEENQQTSRNHTVGGTHKCVFLQVAHHISWENDDTTCFFKSDIATFVSKSRKKSLLGTAAAAVSTQAQRKEKEIATWSGFRRAFYHLPGRRHRVAAPKTFWFLSPDARFLK